MIPNGATIWARQTLDSMIFHKPDKWFKIWFYIVNRANHKDNGQFKRGQCFLTYSMIMDNTRGTRGEIDHCIRWLKKNQMLATQKATRGFTVTVLNYDIYQNLDNYKGDTKSDLKATQKRHRSDTEATQKRHYKQVCNNENNDNNDNNKQLFDEARKIFKGRKNGLEPEYTNFKKKFPNYKDVIPLLKPAIENQIVWRKEDNCFWKTFQTWINNSCWTEEKESYERNNGKTTPTGERKPEDNNYTGPSAYGVAVENV